MSLRFAVGLVVMQLAGCAAVIPAHEVVLPPSLAFDRPPPASILAAETSLSLLPLRTALESALPPRSDGSQTLGGVRVDAALVRQPVRLTVVDGVIVGEMGSRGHLAMEIHGQRCEADDAVLGVEVRLRPEVFDGALRFRDVAVVSKASGRLRCRLGPATVSVDLPADLALPIPGLPSVLQALRLPVGFVGDAALAQAGKPRATALGCLELHPTRVVLSPTHGDGELQLTVGLEVAPYITPGECGEHKAVAAPATRLQTAPMTNAFTVIVALPVALAELQRLATPLVGHELGHTGVVARHIGFSTVAGRLIVRVNVEGALRGDLILIGHPTVENQRLGLPDLALDFASTSAIQRLRFRLAGVLDRHLVDTVRSAATVDLTAALAEARQALTAPIAVGPRSLHLQPSAVRIHQIAVGDSALRVEVAVDGQGLLQ